MHVLTTVTKYLDIAGPLLGVALCLYWSRKRKNAGGYFIILGYLLLQLIANGVAKVMMFIKVPNIKVYQINAFLSLLVISTWLYSTLKKESLWQTAKWLRLLWIVTTCASLLLIWREDAGKLNSLSLSFTALMACLYCMICFFNVLVNTTEADLLRSANFWQASSFFFNYAGCFFIYATFSFFAAQNTKSNFMILWNIHNTLLFLSCVVLGFSCRYLSANEYNDR
jgi:hypothetical protein